MKIKVKLLEHGKGLAIPSYATEGSAGLDLRAALDTPVVLKPLGRCLVPTGFSIAIPAGFEAQIRSRSGLAYKNGVMVLNSPGTIDSDYRGEVKVLLINFGTEDFCVSRGDRIAQMVICKYTEVQLEIAEILEATNRAEGGYGSTGVK